MIDEEEDEAMTKMLEDAITELHPHGTGSVRLQMPSYGIHFKICAGISTLVFSDRLAKQMIVELQKQVDAGGYDKAYPLEGLEGATEAWAQSPDTTKGN